MFNIGLLLDKFKHLKPPRKDIADCVLDVIKNTTGLCLEHKNISVSENTIFVRDSCARKNEIFLHKNIILAQTKEKLPQVRIKDIR